MKETPPCTPPGACEVEFSDNDGRAYAVAALAPEQLLVLHYRPTGLHQRA